MTSSKIHSSSKIKYILEGVRKEPHTTYVKNSSVTYYMQTRTSSIMVKAICCYPDYYASLAGEFLCILYAIISLHSHLVSSLFTELYCNMQSKNTDAKA